MAATQLKRALNSFDNLPHQLKGIYGAQGPRPDLLFYLKTGVTAGEARGRSRVSKSLFPTSATEEQKKRMMTLADWSSGNNGHAYFMSWAWMGPSGVVVDVFLPDDQQAVILLAGTWVEQSGGETWDLTDYRSLEQRRDARGPRRMAPGKRPSAASVLQEARKADTRADRAMDRLFERSPAAGGTLAGIPVRGRWIKGDWFGQATHEVLVGVLAEGLPVDHRATRCRQRGRGGTGLDSYLDGRLLAVAHRLDEPRPSWERIEVDLLDPA